MRISDWSSDVCSSDLLLSEIESHLGMDAVPFSWPVGMGRSFGGVFDIRRNRMRVFRAGQEKRGDQDELIDGLDNPAIAQRFGDAFVQANEEIELINAARSEGRRVGKRTVRTCRSRGA